MTIACCHFRDAYGNCQANFTVLPIQTADNIPPVLSVSATVPPAPAGGTRTALNIQLDEPGTAYYLVMQQGGPGCPATGMVSNLGCRCSG